MLNVHHSVFSCGDLSFSQVFFETMLNLFYVLNSVTLFIEELRSTNNL